MSLRRYRWHALLMLVLHLQACSTWRPSPLSVTAVVADDPSAIRITTIEGERWTLEEPVLVGDSVATGLIRAHCPAGESTPCTATGPDGERVPPTPIEEVASVEVRRVSAVGTFFVVVVGVGATLGLLMLAACSDPDPGGMVC